jgi:hypothetical protein
MNEIWTNEQIDTLSKKFRIRPDCLLHSGAEDYHFPRRSFLKDGYAPPGGYVKDFTVILREGRLHLFHIDGRPGEVCWITGNEISFGHASTSDFMHWIRHPMPLAVGDRIWENEHVWAPYLYRRDHEWYLFYTGQGNGDSFISYATSSDLEKWKRWSNGPIGNAIGRDPFVFDEGSRTILLYTGMNTAQVCACASADMATWELLPDLLRIPGSVAAESVSLHSFGEKYILWFNDFQTFGRNKKGFRAAYAVSDDPFHFDPGSIQEFDFSSDHPEITPSPELCVKNPVPLSIELIARGETKWLVAYFRWHRDRNRLYFGEIDWSPIKARIREISDANQLADTLRFYRIETDQWRE